MRKIESFEQFFKRLFLFLFVFIFTTPTTTITDVTAIKNLQNITIINLLLKCDHKIVVTVIEAPSGLTYCSVSTLAIKLSFFIGIGMDSVWRSVDVVSVVGVGVVVVAVVVVTSTPPASADVDGDADVVASGQQVLLLLSITSTGVVNFFSLT